MREGDTINPAHLERMLVRDLLPGDVHSQAGLPIYKVLNPPQMSINTQLFGFEQEEADSTCYVVAVEYMDGSRGSRLFPPTGTILIYRERETY